MTEEYWNGTCPLEGYGRYRHIVDVQNTTERLIKEAYSQENNAARCLTQVTFILTNEATGARFNCSALLDSGSTDSLLTKDLAKKAGLQLTKKKTTWQTIGGTTDTAHTTSIPTINLDQFTARREIKDTPVWVS